ncbi:hypothetical protein MASR2M78_04740 [Treponema sp.]
MEERLAILYRLKKKFGTDEDAILLHKEKILQEIESLQRMEEDRNKLEAEIEGLEKEIAKKADALSAKRNAASLVLGSKISEILASLGMSKARFEISVQVKSKDAQNKLCGPYGADDIEFLISPNLGEPLKELSKIASGGELSRVMLAIKTVLAHADRVETLVFDEIDTGIGGEVALAVGKHLVEIGKMKQIFCITHLASIAVRADNHLRVAKIVEGGRTLTTVSMIKNEVRREEIARMLAGDSAGTAALAHADELLETYRKRG